MNVSNVDLDVDFMTLGDYDHDNLEQENVVIFIISTWSGGRPPKAATTFCDWLKDMALDFRYFLFC